VLAFDVYRHWETDLRPITLASLRMLTPEQLHWKPEGFGRSAWDLAVHMADCEWHWIYRNALRKASWDEKWDPHQFTDLEQLFDFWARIHRASLEWLQDTPVSQLNRKYPMPYVDLPFATMNWVVYHVVEHEAHHRGQLFMLMRMQGVNPPEI
jgi:uncharacterized damage-inducible protein DinB